MNRGSWCSASVLVVAVLWPVAAFAQAPASAELPKLVVGSVWKYRQIAL
ncbi:hypothetical protein [Accumulibacter sp.]|nr:hypothetical protein [Accumulibacter sp.]MCM8626779.1 hypothetical protein [Accumulibacter sp.]